MKKEFSLLASLVLGLAIISPAFADNWFEHHDSDHDGRWNYNEFRDAHNNWYNAHHGARAYNDRDLRGQFRHYDHDHNGYVTQQEVQPFHRW
jgi:Ca2+-binding EF-hand superfamily protein